MATDLTHFGVGQSEASVIFISLPSGQGVFQSCKLANDILVVDLGKQVDELEAHKVVPLKRS